jgi:hypothetical protein
VISPVARRLLGAVCGENRTHSFETEVLPSNGDIDCNRAEKNK